MRSTTALALVLALALATALAGCASPARESTNGDTGAPGDGTCSNNVCRDTIEVTDPNGNATANSTNTSV